MFCKKMRNNWGLVLTSWLLLLLFCGISRSFAEIDQLLYSFTGKVGNGNYSYYKLSREGNLRLCLDSRQGDCDIYVSDKTLQPDFENYDLQSCTCGEDEVMIDEIMPRPIGIGIYAHPMKELCVFRLNVYSEESGISSGSTLSVHSNSQPNANAKPRHANSQDEEESVLWSLFLGILKLILDIMF